MGTTMGLVHMINFVARVGYFRLCFHAIQNISNKITISCALLIHGQKINKDWLSRVQEVTRGIVESLTHIGHGAAHSRRPC